MKAIIYCENEFGKIDGKVANGLIRHSEKYDIIGVIDSTKEGNDSGMILDNVANGIAIFRNIDQALDSLSDHPDFFIYGIAPTNPKLNQEERAIIFEAMQNGMNIINGLPEFFNEDREFLDQANTYGVTITDMRKPLSRNSLHHFTGDIYDIPVPVITVLGTDCAIGKRTTALKLVEALRVEGVKTTFIATGQTGLLQGAKYGSAIDMLSSGHATGEVEHAILEAVKNELPDIIIVEGQGSLGHPSYTSSSAIIKGSLPDAIIVQHAPKRINYCTYPKIKIDPLQSEIELIEMFAVSPVIAITLNHENMNDEEIDATILEYEKAYQIPVTDVLKKGSDKLINELFKLFPNIIKKEYSVS